MRHPVSTPGRSEQGRAMRAAARVCALALALVGASAPAVAVAQLRAFEFRLDNDQFAFTPGADERWYTSGAFLRLGFDAPAGSVASRAAGAWCARVVGCGAEARTLVTLSLAQRIYTPAFTADTAPQPFDRPYAAALALGAGIVVADRRVRQSLELQLGTVGRGGLGETTQNVIHDVLDQSRARGWDTQLRTRTLAQLGGSHLATFALPWDRSGGVLRAAAVAGTVQTHAELGALLRTGSHGGAPTWPGEGFGARDDGWQAWIGIEGRAVARDRLIDGEATGYASQVRHEPFTATAFVGASFEAVRDWRVELGIAWHSVPFSTPVGGDSLRPQRIGTIGLRWQPAR